MARFFKTTRPELVDNFLYQPPWELAVSVMQKKENDIDNQIQTMEVLRNLPIDYAEIDRDNAMRIKDDIANQVDQLTLNLQQNLLNPDNRLALNNLQRDLQRRYEFGDLNKITQNAQRFRDWEAQLQQLNPAERETYKRAMLQNYRENNPNGAMSGLFEADQMYNTRNLLSEFAEYASKNIKDDSIAKSFDKKEGGYIITREALENGVTLDKINKAFRGWVESQSDLPSYFQNREKYFGEKYFDGQGNLAFDKEGTTLNSIMKATDPLAWSKRADNQSMKPDQFALEQQKFSHDMAKIQQQFANQVKLSQLTSKGKSGGGQDSENMDAGVKIHKGLNKLVDSYRLQKNDLIKTIREKLGNSNALNMGGGLVGGYQIVSDDQLLASIKGNKNLYPELYKQVTTLEGNLNKALTGSWMEYATTIGDKNVDKLRSNLHHLVNGSTKFYIGAGDGETVGDKPTSVNTLMKSSPDKKATFIKDSYVPVPMNTGYMTDDFVKGTVRIEDVKTKQYEDVDVYIKMSEVTPNYNPLAMTGKSDNLTGMIR